MEAVILYTSVPSKVEVENDQRALQNLLEAAHVPFRLLDGANAENKETRSLLFSISGKTAVYPQVFGYDGDVYNFIGDWESISAANEAEQLAALLAPLKKH